MRDDNFQRDGISDSGAEASEIDRGLNAALAKFSAVEPRAGLENRVLANLRAERARRTEWSRLHAVALALTAVFVITTVVFVWRAVNRTAKVDTTLAPARQIDKAGAMQGAVGATNEAHPSAARRNVTAHLRHASLPSVAATDAESSSSQFPLPEPLSEEEKLLLQYVEDDPKNAELVADVVTLAEEWNSPQPDDVKRGKQIHTNRKDSDPLATRRGIMLTKRFVAVALMSMLISGPTMARTSAQDSTPAKAPTPAPPPTPQRAYRFDFSISELENGKIIDSRQYSMDVSTFVRQGSISVGTQVPAGTKPDGTTEYLHAETDIRAQLLDQGTTMSANCNVSSVVPNDGATSTRPVLRTLDMSGSAIITEGRPIILGVADDPNSKRQFQFVVTISDAK